ncbi:prophage endopeptidase [Enterobacter sp. kpr-6]|uniref:lysis protein n=1 Tax=Enterobacter sp. kpr-6 TaxID=1761782 RepID=UPI0008E61491|nr:lysis protein [Enterobacter sp. kpr-6]SFQ98983.1 prophage endopeptidase [Enterobacter sp. kpr-6]
MKFDWKLVLLLVVMATPGALAFWYHGKAADEQHRADTAEHNLNLANDTINDMQARQRDVAALDAKYTGEIAHEKAENEKLRADVVAGKRRLQLKATCPERGARESSSMDDGAGPQLTADAELNYWRLRDGISTLTKQLTGLQQYVREQCPG